MLYSEHMGFFNKAKDMYALQKQAKTLKKELKNIHIEAECDGVTVNVSAEQEIMSISISDSVWANLKGAEFGKKKIEEASLKAINKAMKKAQEIAGVKMKGIWQSMGIQQ